VLVGLVAAAGVVLVPRMIGPALRVVRPIARMKQSQAALERLSEQRRWRRPETETLSAEQLDRFFVIRRSVDHARRAAGPELDRFPRKRVRSLEELRQVPTIIEGVSDMVTGELDAFVAANMTPDEYHWIARVVYEHWRGALKREGRYPAAVRSAAAEIEAAAEHEPDARVRTRLRQVAKEMREREPAPPAGFDPATHRLLLARLDDVERWSLDDIMSPFGATGR
jgi:hypothetical protein